MIQALLFERPVYLAVVLAATLLVTAIMWSRRRTAGARYALIGVASAAPLLLILQAVVKTDRERITLVCSALADAVERGDVDAFATHVADDFSATAGTADPIPRAELIDALRAGMTRYHPEGIRLSELEINVNGDTATVEFTASARVSVPNAVVDRVVSRWRLRFVRHGASWQLMDLEPIPTPFWPVRNLRDIL